MNFEKSFAGLYGFGSSTFFSSFGSKGLASRLKDLPGAKDEAWASETG